MPLRKLWNSICGTQKTEPAEASPTKNPEVRASPTNQKRQPKAQAPKRGILNLVSKGPNAALCRHIKKLKASTVLEVGIGDGTRAEDIIQTLRSTDPNAKIHYSVIDQFEMNGGEVTLKDYHQNLRTIGVTPNLIPMPVEQGLHRVANTVGFIELIVLGEVDMTAVAPVLERITNESTVVLKSSEDGWQKIESHQNKNRKAA